MSIMKFSFRRSGNSGSTKGSEKKAERKKQEPLVFTTKTSNRIPTAAQLRYFPALLNTQERVALWIGLVVLLIGLPLFAGRSYYRVTEEVPAFGGSYTEGVVGQLQYANPILSPLSDVDADVTSLVFSSLFSYDDNQDLQNDLVTNYTLSDDKKTYTLYVRTGVKWHDGEELNVDDILFTIEAIQDKQYQSPLFSTLAGVAIKRIDDYTFSLALSEPFAPFISSLTFGILPEHLWYDVPPQNVRLTELNITPIGSGPFKFEEATKDKSGTLSSFTVTRNEDYYGEKPYLDEMSFRFYPDIDSAITALQSRKVEGLAFIPQSEREEIEKKKDIVFSSLRLPQYTAVFFNQKNTEVLQSLEVREALAHAVHRNQIITNVLDNQGEAMYTAILPGYLGYNPEVEKYQDGAEESKRILEEAGWVFPDTNTAVGEDTADEIDSEAEEETVASASTATTSIENTSFRARKKDGVELSFSLATVDLPEYQAVAEILQEQWESIGAKVIIDIYSAEDIQQRVIRKRDYDAILFAEIIGNDPDPYPFWHSSQMTHPGLALSIFRNTDIDALLDDARKSTDDESRRLKYLEFQNTLAANVPAVFLYNPQYLYAVNEKIQGINENQYIAAPADRFAGIEKWYVKTKRTMNSTEESTETESTDISEN